MRSSNENSVASANAWRGLGKILAHAFLAIGLGAVALLARAPDTAPSTADRDEHSAAEQGFDLLMDGNPDAAIQLFHQIQQNDPQSPLGYLLDAEALWWKIYYSTARLLEPDVFDVAWASSSPYDYHFSDLIRVANSRAEERIRAGQDVARNTLYQGMAYALTARLDGLRGRDLATSRAGKKMRALLLSSLHMDPNLIDANLGLGIYNYYIDTLPAPLKLFRMLDNLPAGNRNMGLEMLQRTAQHGDLLRGEAKFYLAKDYSLDGEKKYQQALELFQELARSFPHNQLWALLAANMEARLGKSDRADSLYREVFKDTEKADSQSDTVVHLAARDVLVRSHPREAIGQ